MKPYYYRYFPEVLPPPKTSKRKSDRCFLIKRTNPTDDPRNLAGSELNTQSVKACFPRSIMCYIVSYDNGRLVTSPISGLYYGELPLVEFIITKYSLDTSATYIKYETLVAICTELDEICADPQLRTRDQISWNNGKTMFRETAVLLEELRHPDCSRFTLPAPQQAVDAAAVEQPELPFGCEVVAPLTTAEELLRGINDDDIRDVDIVAKDPESTGAALLSTEITVITSDLVEALADIRSLGCLQAVTSVQKMNVAWQVCLKITDAREAIALLERLK